MSLNISFAIFLLGLALSQAIPTRKIEESLTKSNLKLEETGEEVERSKKSVVCLDSGSMTPQLQSYNIQTAPQVQTLSIQPAGQSVQTLNIQAIPQQVHTLSIQSVPQPIQTVSVIQPPAPAMKLIQHPPNPCPPSQTNVNIIQPLKEEKPVKVRPPVIEAIVHEKIIKSEPKPEKLVVPKVEKQIMMPTMPVYEEQVVMVPPKPMMLVAEAEPMTSCVKEPHCHTCQQAVMQCSCKSHGVPAMRPAVMVEPAMHLVEVRERPVGRHMLTPMHRSLIHNAVTGLLEFVILLALTGVLASVAAVLRLMELTINLIHPLTVFVLHQFGKLIIFGAGQSKRLTSHAFEKIRTMDCGRTPLVQINMRQPYVCYYRSAIPGLVEETYPLRLDSEMTEEQASTAQAADGNEIKEHEIQNEEKTIVEEEITSISDQPGENNEVQEELSTSAQIEDADGTEATEEPEEVTTA
ncbi:hypothetical protein WN48_10663 [Eufriesea mexicana]|uniref:Zonadhesin n=1 Tax=Eufriesea mexicana TaxID=516756 RepID=A0A310SFY7_9HYME|nr:hypothetical protein WN48_10663 [Eufriesea mexicana]